MLQVAQKFMQTGPDWWMTLTFRNPATRNDTAAAALRCWLSLWRAKVRSDTGRHPAPSPLSRLFWCAETQSRGTAHIHALSVTGVDQPTPHCRRCFQQMGYNQSWPLWLRMKESWFVHHGIARIYPFDCTRVAGVVAYIVKYMWKTADPEWGLWVEGEDY